MGQKIHPKGLRLGIIRDWDAKWFAKKRDFADVLHEDIRLRRYVLSRVRQAGVPQVDIERSANRVKVTLHTAKPGVVIGKGGGGVELLRKSLEDMTGKRVAVNIVEVRAPELNAQLVAESVATSLEKRISFKRAMRQAVTRTMRMGAKGIKVMTSGRLGGSEMSRREWYWEGSVPLHTLRADVDYGFAEAKTTYGQIGVKVWINRGELMPGQAPPEEQPRRDRRDNRRPRGKRPPAAREG